jgi:hemoglobin-like flavoprotein
MIAGSIGHPNAMRLTAVGEASATAGALAAMNELQHGSGILATEELTNVVDQVSYGQVSHERVGDRELTVYEVLDFTKPDTYYLVQTSFEIVAARKNEAAKMFYDHLFEIAPHTRKMFDNVDLAVQGSMLMNMIAAAVKGLDRLDELKPVLVELGKRHRLYGAQIEHYAAVEACLLHTIETANVRPNPTKIVLNIEEIVLSIEEIVLNIEEIVINVEEIVLTIEEIVINIEEIVLSIEEIVLNIIEPTVDVRWVISNAIKVLCDLRHPDRAFLPHRVPQDPQLSRVIRLVHHHLRQQRLHRLVRIAARAERRLLRECCVVEARDAGDQPLMRRVECGAQLIERHASAGVVRRRHHVRADPGVVPDRLLAHHREQLVAHRDHVAEDPVAVVRAAGGADDALFVRDSVQVLVGGPLGKLQLADNGLIEAHRKSSVIG